jgi:hypothetical protein
MAEMELPLAEQYSAVISAAGEALISNVGPVRAFERWEISSTQTFSDSVAQTRLEVYDRSGLSRLVEGTYSGNLDTSNTVFKVGQGEALYYKWSKGTPGALVRLTINGSKFTKRVI